ncbi:MAG: hypothetical protein KY457_05425 [Actinobacteria bacterium]|nr:hypothetical protein [Actinomycetota bacterium]
MRARRALSVVLLLPAILLGTTACDATGDDPAEILTDPPFGEAPDDDPADDPATPLDEAGATGDDPVPVEEDGGIGGAGGGPVTSNLILSSDAGGADQVEVTGTCLVGEEPPTYRLDLAGGGALTVATGDEGGRLELELDGVTFRSSEDEPPTTSASEGALSVQGRAVADGGDERFVDAVIGLDDLPAC